MLDWLADTISKALSYITDAILWVFDKLIGSVLGAIASILESIQVPSWATSTGGFLSAVPADVMYYAEPMNLGTGLGIIFGAYGVRFLVRRIPVIG